MLLEFEYAEKAIEAGADLEFIFDNDPEVVERLTYMVFSVYYTDNIYRSEELVEYFQSHNLPKCKLFDALLPRIFKRELAYFAGLKFPIIFRKGNKTKSNTS